MDAAESITASHPSTGTYRPSRARIHILQQCRNVVYNIHPGQSGEADVWDTSRLYPQRTNINLHPVLVVEFVVAVNDEETGELWDCNAIARRNQIYLTNDGSFRLAGQVMEPGTWVLSRKTDSRNRELPRYAGTLVFMFPAGGPLTYTVWLKLLHKRQNQQEQELDMVQFLVQTYDRGTELHDLQTGALANIEKPVSKLRMSGILAKDKGRKIIKIFQDLGDNGRYDEFVIKKRTMCERLNRMESTPDVKGLNGWRDILLAVRLEESIIQFGQNKMDDCIATCQAVCADATGSANSKFLQAKAFYIISAVYRQRKDFTTAMEHIEYSNQCIEPLALCEETAVNRYNMGALLAEKAATEEGITKEERAFAEQCFKDVSWLWTQQKENSSMRDVIRSYNRMITLFLMTSRQKFPDLRCNVSMSDISKAQAALEHVQKNLLAACPKRLEATFLIAMADVHIRKATIKATETIVTLEDRVRDLERAQGILEKAMQICGELKMEKDIEGIEDRHANIAALSRDGLQQFSLNTRTVPPQNNQENGRTQPMENDYFEDQLDSLFVDEEDESTLQQCSERTTEYYR